MGRRALFAVAAIALGAGALLLGALTSPEPEAAAVTTTTSTTTTTAPLHQPIDYENFTVDQIATGDQFQWSKVAEVPNGSGASLVSQLGLLYLFTSSQAQPGGVSAGLHAHRTFDAVHWEDLGEVVPTDEHSVDVAATPYGLMAVSRETADGTLVAWRSTDAINWDRTVVEQADPGLGVTFFSQALGASDSLVVVAGTTFENGSPMLRERLQEHGIDVDLNAFNWSLVPGNGEYSVVLHGPLGLPALSIAASELGLTDEDAQILQGRSIGSTDAQVWSTSDGVNWSSTTIERAHWISSITPAPDGGILVFGADSAGDALWRTLDGVNFEKLPFMRRAESAEPWRGGLAGLRSSGNPPEVVVSSDGETWEGSGLAEHFPHRSSWTWYPTSFATGDAGIAVSVTGNTPGRPQSQEKPIPPVLERDGFTLTLDFDEAVMHLDDGRSTRSWQLWSYRDVVDNLVLDLGEQTITFLDSSGNPQVTFTFEELEAAQIAYVDRRWRDDSVNALAFSKDGTTWSIQDLDKVFGEQANVVDLAVTPFSLVAVVSPSPENLLSSGQGELQIWSAPLPGR